LDLNQRAMALCRMADRFDKPVFVLMDHSRFDAHVNLQLLRAEHSVYKWCCMYDPFLVKLLRMQEFNRGETAGGIKYTVKGKRMSGEVTTACGNSIINYGCISSWLELSGVHGEIFLDGDDSVVVVESSDLANLVDCKAHMVKLGMVTEFEIVGHIADVEFCQSKVGLGRRGPYLCPNPRKWLETTTLMAETRTASTAYAVFRSTVGCLLAQNPASPMLKPFWSWCKANPGVLRVADSWRYRAVEGYGFDVNSQVIADWVEPTLDERVSYWLNWGVDPPTQVAYESEQAFVGLLDWEREARPKVREEVDDQPLDWDDWVGEVEDRDLSLLTWELAGTDFQRRWTAKLTGDC
jgi:hypothetical protein